MNVFGNESGLTAVWSRRLGLVVWVGWSAAAVRSPSPGFEPRHLHHQRRCHHDLMTKSGAR